MKKSYAYTNIILFIRIKHNKWGFYQWVCGPWESIKVIGLVLMWRLILKPTNGCDCKYFLVNIRIISQNNGASQPPINWYFFFQLQQIWKTIQFHPLNQ